MGISATKTSDAVSQTKWCLKLFACIASFIIFSRRMTALIATQLHTYKKQHVQNPFFNSQIFLVVLRSNVSLLLLLLQYASISLSRVSVYGAGRWYVTGIPIGNKDCISATTQTLFWMYLQSIFIWVPLQVTRESREEKKTCSLPASHIWCLI